MDRLSIECPQCGKCLKVRKKYAGKKARCPACDSSFTVRERETDDSPSPEPAPDKAADPTEETTSEIPAPARSWVKRLILAGSITVLLVLAGITGYAVYRSATTGQARESASRLVRSGREAISEDRYGLAERLLQHAVRKLEMEDLVGDASYSEATAMLAHLQKGEVVYKGRWMSPEEKQMRSQGYVKHEGRWVTPEAKAKLSQGYIQHDGEWVSPDEKGKLDEGLVKFKGRWMTPEKKEKLVQGLVQVGDMWIPQEARSRLSKAVFIPIKGPVGVDTVEVVKLGLEAAAEEGAGTVVLELDTPGGSVSAAREIASLIDQKVGPKQTVVRAVAYLSGGDFGGAWSAGAFLAFSCDSIYARTGTAMGAAQQVVKLGGTSVPVKYFAGGAKMDSAWIGTFRAQAEKNGHPPAVAEAMAREECKLWALAKADEGTKFALEYSDDSELTGAGFANVDGGDSGFILSESFGGAESRDLIKKQGQILSLTAGQIDEFGIGKVVPEGKKLNDVLDVEQTALSDTSFGPKLDRITREWARVRKELNTKLKDFFRHMKALDTNLRSAVAEGSPRRFSHRLKRSSHHLNQAAALAQDLVWLGVDYPDLGLDVEAMARAHFLLRRLQRQVLRPGGGRSLPTAVRLDEYVAGAKELAFGKGGKLLASVDRRGTISFWDVDSELRLASYPGSASGSTSVAVDPEGKLFACANGNEVVLREIRTGRVAQKFEGHRSFFRAVEISPSGDLLAGGNLGGTVTLWPLGGSGDVRTINAHESGLSTIAFSRDGTRLATGSREGAVKVWSAKTGELLQNLEGHSRPVTAVSFRPGDDVLASASTRGKIILWDTIRGDVMQKITDLDEAVLTLEFSPNGKYLASGGRDRRVRLWDANSGRVVQLLATCNSAVECVTFSRSGEHLAGSATNGRIRVWDAEESEESRASETSGNADQKDATEARTRFARSENVVREKLRETSVVIDLSDTPLRDAIKWLQQISSVDLKFDPAGVPDGITVSVQGEVTIQKALDSITTDRRVDWKIEGDSVLIGAAAKLKAQ